jgi:hypothetical protein
MYKKYLYLIITHQTNIYLVTQSLYEIRRNI